MKDQLERNLYQHLVMAFAMGIVTVWLCIQPEPSWITVRRAIELRRTGAVFIDTRTERGFAKNGYPGAMNIPFAELEERVGEIPRDRPIVVYGAFGDDSVRTYDFLKARGYDVYDLGPRSRMPRDALHQHQHQHEHHEHHESPR